MMHGAERLTLNPKAVKKSLGQRSLAASDGAARQPVAEAGAENLSRSQPIPIPDKGYDDFSPNIYFGLGTLLEKKNSHTPGDFSGR